MPVLSRTAATMASRRRLATSSTRPAEDPQVLRVPLSQRVLDLSDQAGDPAPLGDRGLVVRGRQGVDQPAALRPVPALHDDHRRALLGGAVHGAYLVHPEGPHDSPLPACRHVVTPWGRLQSAARPSTGPPGIPASLSRFASDGAPCQRARCMAVFLIGNVGPGSLTSALRARSVTRWFRASSASKLDPSLSTASVEGDGGVVLLPADVPEFACGRGPRGLGLPLGLLGLEPLPLLHRHGGDAGAGRGVGGLCERLGGRVGVVGRSASGRGPPHCRPRGGLRRAARSAS